MLRDHKDHKVLLAQLVHKDHKAHLVHQDPQEIQVQLDHPVQQLLDHPNPTMDGGEFIHVVWLYMALTGHAPIEIARPGEIIVIENRVRADAPGWGGLLSLAAKTKGLGGVVTDGPARDVDECEQLGFPVYSSSVVPISSPAYPNISFHRLEKKTQLVWASQSHTPSPFPANA